MTKKKHSQNRKDLSKFFWLASFACFGAVGYRHLPESITSSIWFFVLVVLAVFLMFWFVLATTPDEKKIKRQKKLDERAAYAANIDARFKKNPNSQSRENEPPLF